MQQLQKNVSSRLKTTKGHLRINLGCNSEPTNSVLQAHTMLAPFKEYLNKSGSHLNMDVFFPKSSMNQVPIITTCFLIHPHFTDAFLP